jgi:hypothetical protein
MFQARHICPTSTVKSPKICNTAAIRLTHLRVTLLGSLASGVTATLSSVTVAVRMGRKSSLLPVMLSGAP